MHALVVFRFAAFMHYTTIRAFFGRFITLIISVCSKVGLFLAVAKFTKAGAFASSPMGELAQSPTLQERA